jgi:hypothetical protein
MKKYFVFILLYLIAPACFCQVNQLNASTLASTLKENAHSVKREEKITFEVKDIDKARLSVHQLITVLDAEDEYILNFNQYSSSFQRLENATIKVFDALGKKINEYKMKEMKMQAIGSGLVVDGKIYYFRVAAPVYPITVEYDFEIIFKGTLNYPDYEIVPPDQAVEHSIFTASVPENLDLKFKPKNISLNPVIINAGKNKTYTWEVKNLPAVKIEEGAVSSESYPSILLAPNKFSMDGKEGDFSTWKDFGIWYYNLCKQVNNLSEATKNQMKEMVKNATADKEKIRIIYNYLQANFRYVSIQLGIGGYKPFDANFVDKNKYGDCKALSFYMKACLDAVNITSYPALINAEYNKEPVDPAFPHNSFNHMILCVPGAKDTTWLECTSNTADFGILGNFTENKNALLITPDGGVLVATPKSKSSSNTFHLFTKIILKEDASGESESVLKTSGEYKDEIISSLKDEKKDDQKEYLVNHLGFLQPDDFSLKSESDDGVEKTDFKLMIEKVPDFSAGSKMFLNPRIYKIWNYKFKAEEKRTRSFYFPFPFIKTDTTVYQLPENYTVENLPKARDIKFDYGVFKTDYIYDEKKNTVTSIAFLQLSQYIIPADKFLETRKFFSQVIQEYTEKIVIKRK